MEKTNVPPRTMLIIVLGFTFWSAAFVGLYAINAIGCAFLWPEESQRMVMIGLTVASSAVALAIAVWSILYWMRAKGRQQPVPSIARIGVFGSTAALAATVFTFAPSFFVSMCI